jgi:hypothetical protein
MLAYVFWHRPADGVAPDAYAPLIARFHRSLARQPPGGFLHSASFALAAGNLLGEQPAFEDWYVVEDFAALGVLAEAAVAPPDRARGASTGCSRARPRSRTSA